MNLSLFLDNISNPALLFFILGILAVLLKSDLEIPPSSSKFISLYLLFCIGFKGGLELAQSHFSMEIVRSLLFGIGMAALIPVYVFFILKKQLNVQDSGAIAAAYGSVSAVTFVTAISFLESQNIAYNGHMVAVMAVMEAPSIVMGLILIRLFDKEQTNSINVKKVVSHAVLNGSVFLIVGSLIIGLLASEKQAQGIKPFTTDIFKGFLAIFLLDMGIISGRKLKGFFSHGILVFLVAIFVPLINGCIAAFLSSIITTSAGNRFIFAVLAASASYIAVPATMKIAVPKANPGLYLPMALAITFPFNITLGMPIFLSIVNTFHW